MPLLTGFAARGGRLPCFEPGFNKIFEEASPTYKNRFMFMAGYEMMKMSSTGSFRDLIFEPGVSDLRCPLMVLGGESDEFAPIKHVFEVTKNVPGPVDIVVYQNERHAPGRLPSSQLGPHWYALMADWLAARVCDRIPIGALALSLYHSCRGGRRAPDVMKISNVLLRRSVGNRSALSFGLASITNVHDHINIRPENGMMNCVAQHDLQADRISNHRREGFTCRDISPFLAQATAAAVSAWAWLEPWPRKPSRSA